jgi:hypothetical protein
MGMTGAQPRRRRRPSWYRWLPAGCQGIDAGLRCRRRKTCGSRGIVTHQVVQESTYQHNGLNRNGREAHREEEAWRGPVTRNELTSTGSDDSQAHPRESCRQ